MVYGSLMYVEQYSTRLHAWIFIVCWIYNLSSNKPGYIPWWKCFILRGEKYLLFGDVNKRWVETKLVTCGLQTPAQLNFEINFTSILTSRYKYWLLFKLHNRWKEKRISEKYLNLNNVNLWVSLRILWSSVFSVRPSVLSSLILIINLQSTPYNHSNWQRRLNQALYFETVWYYTEWS